MLMMGWSLFSQPVARRGLLMVMMVVLGCASVSAQELPPFDSGVQALSDAGLMTVSDQTMTDDDVDLTIQYAYADTQRILVRVKLAGDYEPYLQDHMLSFLLRDDTARSFSYSAALPVTREDDEIAEVYDVVFYNQTSYQPIVGDFEIIDGYLDDYGDRIDFQLDVGFVPMSALGMVLDAADAIEKSPAGPFGFIFTVTIYHPVEIRPVETQTVGDIAVTLERVTIAPSETEVEVCYTLPDGQDWQPEILLTMGDVTAPASGANLVGMWTLELPDRCVEQRFSVFGGAAGTLTVTVNRLITSVPDRADAWEGLVDELETFGIEAEAFADPGTYFTIQATPEGMTDAELAEIINTAREHLRHVVEGPWVFEVTLPQ